MIHVLTDFEGILRAVLDCPAEMDPAHLLTAANVSDSAVAVDVLLAAGAKHVEGVRHVNELWGGHAQWECAPLPYPAF